jgi:hypothetical protein
MWETLSNRQRNVLIGLALANVILLASIGTLALSPAPAATPTALPAAPDTSVACQAEAASALAHREVAGTIALRADGSVDFALSGDDPSDAWAAFAVSAELAANGCGPYDPVRVDVPDPSRIPGLRLVVEARWADVQAWSQGRLDDETLSDRAARSTYLRADAAPRP